MQARDNFKRLKSKALLQISDVKQAGAFMESKQRAADAVREEAAEAVALVSRSG